MFEFYKILEIFVFIKWKVKIIFKIKTSVHINFSSGWNDPPKFVPPPTGNLKINLNKRVAFPLSKPAATEPSSSLPPMPPTMNLPPSIPPPVISSLNHNDDDSSFDPKVELEKVMEIFNRILAQSDHPVQASAKLKSLTDEWSSYDINLMKLITELANCMLNLF